MTDRQTDKKTDRQKDRQTDRQTDRLTHKRIHDEAEASWKLTNFGEVFIVDRVVCSKSDGNIKDAEGQGWVTRFEIKLLAHLSAEEIAFPCEVFSKFY